MSSAKKNTTKKHNRKLEYLLINVFTFVGIGLISLFLLNFALFNPFKLALKDFSLTDIYYSKIQNKDSIYGGNLALVNVENLDRTEIAFLLRRIQEGKPKVVGVDVIFPDRKDEGDSLLKAAFDSSSNLVLPFAAKFDEADAAAYNHDFFGQRSNSFVNLIGENREFSTIRSFYPYYQGKEAFTTAIMKAYDPALAKPLVRKGEKKMDIRYFGNLQNFRFYTFEQVMAPEFDVSVFQDKIILMGYLGLAQGAGNDLDEDRFYTPLNPKMAGRSHPDMYGLVIHANIIRMALDGDYVTSLPGWLNWTIAFLLCLVLIPLFSYWYIHRAMWSHFFTKLTQLAVSILFMYLTILLYARGNLKIDAASVLVAVLLLGDFVLFYDGFVKYFRFKRKWNFHSIFFEGHGH